MWDGVIETRDFVKHTIQNARFRKTHTKGNKTNHFENEFVLFFSKEYFGVKIRLKSK